MGSGILFTYPQIATIAGLHGMLVYTISSALPLLAFAYLGPKIRKACPNGFVLTEWVRQRYGIVTGLFLSFLTLVTLFLYAVAELSAVGEIVNTLTGLNPIAPIIVECAVTTIYTCKSG
jgi:Na+/proline symporter